jgi:hypothetical protein
MRARRPAYAAALLAAALVVTGCSTTKSGQVDSGPVGQGSLGGDTNPSPGVTADTVVVGAIFTDLGTVTEQLGFKSDPLGDPDKQVAALTQWVNANGGLGGRQMDLVKKIYKAETDSPQAEEALCRSWTQDVGAFAVVLTGQLQANARKCYAKGRTVMVDNASYPLDRQGYAELAPYLWAPGNPVYEDFLPEYVTSLNEQEFFTDAAAVGVVSAESPTNRRAWETLLKPALAEVGVTDPQIGFVDTLDVAAINTSLFQIAQDFKEAGVDRVLFLGGARLAGLWPISAQINGVNARLGLSSFDNPAFFGRNPDLWTSSGFTENPATGAVGISFQPATDIDDAQLPFPSSFSEQQCASIYAAGGITFATRQEARLPFQLCDAILFLKSSMDRVQGEVTPRSFGEAAAALQGQFQSSGNYATYFSVERQGGPAASRNMKFDTACSCLVLTGDQVPLGDVPPIEAAADGDATTTTASGS